MTTVFGLDVLSSQPLAFLEGARAAPTGRELELALLAGDEELAWSTEAELVSDQRCPDGGVNFQIEAATGAGFRIWGPRYGATVISGDGQRIRGIPGSEGLSAWQRLLVAQVLPFAAVIQGLEVLHASAIAVGSAAIALSGPSGSGKTSLALELCRRGARFLADDVLAIEREGKDLIGHPGAPIVGIDAVEAKRLALLGHSPLRELASDAREQVSRAPSAAQPTPLRAFFLLERRPDGPGRPRFEAAADARALLSSTFNLVLTTPGRLERLLDVSARLAACRVERILYGPAVSVAELGEAVEERIGARA